MLLGTLCKSLLRNMLAGTGTGKGIIHSGKKNLTLTFDFCNFDSFSKYIWVIPLKYIK